MKLHMTCLVAVTTIFFSAITIVTAQTDDQLQSVLQQDIAPQPVLQEPAGPALVAPQTDPGVQPLPLEPTAPQVLLRTPTPLTAAPAPQPIVQAPTPLVAATPAQGCCCSECGRSCGKRPRRCCPEPVPTEFCLVDPCGCSHEACIEIPPCCCGQQPTIQWRAGAVGRQIAILCWECCGFEAKVIVTRKGKVRVRD